MFARQYTIYCIKNLKTFFYGKLILVNKFVFELFFAKKFKQLHWLKYLQYIQDEIQAKFKLT